MSFARDFERQLNRTGRPATTILVAVMAASFVLAWFTQSPFFIADLGFLSWAKPWTIFTYPFASEGADFIGVVLELFWLWQIGGEVESVVGSGRYTIFFFVAAVFGALGITIGHVLTGGTHFVPLTSPLLPIGAVTVAWATRNPSANVRLMAVIPITAFWIAWIYAGVVLFNLGSGAPILGVCALLPLAFAWAFASNRIPGVPMSAAVAEKQSRAAKLRANEFDKQVKSRKQEREDRERLRKLLEGSLHDKTDFEDK